jgi:hypothetical protein
MSVNRGGRTRKALNRNVPAGTDEMSGKESMCRGQTHTRLPGRRLGEGGMRLQLRRLIEGFRREKAVGQLEMINKIDARCADRKDIVAKKHCEDRLVLIGPGGEAMSRGAVRGQNHCQAGRKDGKTDV